MTISSALTREIFACNGVTTARTVPFKILDETHLRIVKYTIATGATADLVLNTDYTVGAVGAANCTFTTIGASSPYSSAYKLIALLDMPLSQAEDYVANDAFPAESHESALDKLTLIVQQQGEQLSRAALLPEFLATSLAVILPTPVDGYGIVWDGVTGTIRNTTVSMTTLETQAAALYAIAANITTVAGISAAVTTVAGISANVTTVAGVASAVSAVAAVASNVTTVAGNLTNINTVAGISGNVTTVASISANVTTLAGLSTEITGVYNIRTDVQGVYTIRANVTTVAGISGNVTTVAGISANVTTVAGNTTNINTVASVSANVTTVAGISTAVSTVSTNIASVNTCATNIAAILDAPTQAAAAAASAVAAAAAAAGISMKSSCRAATTVALTVTYANGSSGVGATLTNAGAQAAFALDGVTLALNERVLIKDQASALQNGIYTCTTLGSGAINWVLTRSTDYDTAAEILEGTATIIAEGTVNASHIFVMTHNGAITVGTTAIDYTALTANATSANTLTTPRAIYGNNFDGSAALTQIIASTYGGTGNGFAKLSGPASTEKTFTLPNASATILTDNALVTAAQGGTANGFFAVSGPATSTKTFTFPNASATVLTSNAAVTEAQGGTNQTTYTQGDILYASAANTLSKLAKGTSLQQLRMNAGATIPEWATISSSASVTQLATSTPGAVATVDFTSIAQTYRALLVFWNGVSNASATRKFFIQPDDGAGAFGSVSVQGIVLISATAVASLGSGSMLESTAMPAASTAIGSMVIHGYQGAGHKPFTAMQNHGDTSAVIGSVRSTAAITGLRFMWDSAGNFDAGTITLYGIS